MNLCVIKKTCKKLSNRIYFQFFGDIFIKQRFLIKQRSLFRYFIFRKLRKPIRMVHFLVEHSFPFQSLKLVSGIEASLLESKLLFRNHNFVSNLLKQLLFEASFPTCYYHSNLKKISIPETTLSFRKRCFNSRNEDSNLTWNNKLDLK